MDTAKGHPDGFWRRTRHGTRHETLWPRVGRWAARIFLAAMVLYLAAANVFLMTGLFRRLINFDTEHLRFEYVRAYSIVPGWVHFDGAAIRGRDGSVEWIVTVDRCDFVFRPFGLALRKFHASHVRAEGLSIRARLRVDTATPEHLAALPPIPGFDYPPWKDPGPEELPPTDANYSLWGVQLDDIVADPIPEVWIDTIRFRGELRVHGRWLFRPNRWLEVGPADVDVRRMDVSYGKTPLFTGGAGHALVTVHPSDVRRYAADDGLGILDFVSTRFDVAGHVHAADGLQALAIPDAAFERGEGPWVMHLDLRWGVVSEGTELATGFPDAEAKVWGTAVGASVVAKADVAADGGGKPVLTTTFDAERVHASRGGAELDVPKAAFALTSHALAIAHGPLDDAAFRADVPAARTQSLQPWLSSVPQLGVRAGRAQTSAHLEGSFAKKHVSGRIDAALDDVDLEPPGNPRVRVTASATARAAGEYDGAAELLSVGDGRVSVHEAEARFGAEQRAFVRIPAATVATEGFSHAAARGLRGRIAIDVPQVAASDLSALGDVTTLPKDVTLERGTPRARATVTLDLASLALDGTAELDASGVRAHLGSKALSGNAALRLRAAAHAGATDLSGSTFSFDSVVAARGGAPNGAPNTAPTPPSGDGWWSRAELTSCALRIPGGPTFDGQIHFMARDATPFTAMIASRTPVPAWAVNAFLPMTGLDVTGRIRSGPSGLAVRSLVARGSGNTIELEYDSRAKDAAKREQWAFLVEAGAIGASFCEEGGHTEFALSNARSWYESKVASLRESSAP